MPNLINLNAEVGADFIGDDAGNAAGVAFRSAATEGAAALFTKTVAGSPTVAVVQFSTNSTASAPILELQNQGFVSATTILFTTGATAGVGAVRVKYGNNYGWIPVLPDGSVTGAAR